MSLGNTQRPPVAPASPGIPDDELERRFNYHTPVHDQPERYVRIREIAKQLAYTIRDLTPPSREQSLALTELEQAVFWANASIARRE